MHFPIRPPSSGLCLREAAVTPLTRSSQQPLQRVPMVGMPGFFAGWFALGLWDGLVSPAGSFRKGAELMPPVWSSFTHRSSKESGQRHVRRRQRGDKRRLACNFG